MIGKTRQPLPERRGILNQPPPAPAFRLSRRFPAEQLAPFIQYYWLVSWDLRDQISHTQETLPDPNVHVVFEKGNSHVFGVVSGKFSRLLIGRSQVFGIRFVSAMFRPFIGSSVSALTDSTAPVGELFGGEALDLEEVLTSQSSEDERVAAADRFWSARIPVSDPRADIAREIVDTMREERDLLTVDQVCERAAIQKRTLQRLFVEYVGISPKWVIRRYRLHEAVASLRAGADVELADLALSLGYFDQAHLINDFKSIIGYTPSRFQKLQ